MEQKLAEAIDKVLALSTADIYYDPSFGDHGAIQALDDFRSALGELCRLRAETIEPKSTTRSPLMIVEIAGGMVSSIRMTPVDGVEPEVEVWDWDTISRKDEAITALGAIVSENNWVNVPFGDCRFMEEN